MPTPNPTADFLLATIPPEAAKPLPAAAAFVVLPLACYLCGSIPFGWLAGRLKGIDIRKHGSGNPGATNVGRVMGRGWGLAVFALDVLKGLVPVLAAGMYLSTRMPHDEPRYHLARVLCAFAAVAGHVWTFWLSFKGGKGVATALGALLAIWPEYTLAGAAAFGVWLAVVGVGRIVSLGSITAAAAFPVAYFAIQGGAVPASQWPLAVFAVLTAVLIIVKHRSNIGRLLAGTEPRLGRPAPDGAAPAAGAK